MTEKILATGFDRFGHLKRPNRSSEIALPAVKEKYADLVETLILPTSRKLAAEQLLVAINEIQPAAVVMFGISGGRGVRLEKQAKNRRFNVLIPDNDGNRAVGKIDPRGPKSYESTLPLDDLYERLNEENVPVRMSADAGAFVCNELMYKALQHTNEHNSDSVLPTGFVHFGNGLSDQLLEEASLLVVDELIDYSGVQQ